MPVAEIVNKKIEYARTFRAIKADGNKEIPTRIELIKAGEWPDDCNKGLLIITTADLLEFAKNFNDGVGMPGGAGFGLPIDFGHEDWGKAAGWIKSVEADNDILYANVEWTEAGLQALRSGEYKCISPSFYPSCIGSWHDPEDWSVTAQNVLVGAGLTNIPFFKDLKPLMATNSTDDRNVIYVTSEVKGDDKMTLDEVLVKESKDLTEDERNLVVAANNEGKLNADQQVKFGFEVKNKEEPVVTTDNKIDAAAFTKLEATVTEQGKVIADQGKVITEYRRKEVEAFVDAQLERGALKADQRDAWVTKITADESLKTLLESVPSNIIASTTRGDTGEPAITAAEEIRTKASDMVKAAREAGETLDLSTAYSRVMASDSDLASRYEQEVKEVK